MDTSLPLAEKMRPQSFDTICGQVHLVSKRSLLRRLAEEDRFQSLLLWGPTGCGKTTLARLIAEQSQHDVSALCAVHASVKDLREVIALSEEQRQQLKPVRILLLDEIHRLSKNQQDVLLPHLESGSLKMVGTTTENPVVEVNPAIRSRSLTFRLKPLDAESIFQTLKRANIFCEHSLKDQQLKAIAFHAQGDVRAALNLFEAYGIGFDGSSEDFDELLSSLPLKYGKNSDDHYNSLSAMIKSIRGSHCDAAVYYLARLLEGGCDPALIARRLIVSASEDIGNANPHALNVATSGAAAVQYVGMPEVRIVLSQVCLFLASSPKSRSCYFAIANATHCVRQTKNLDIPEFLHNSPKGPPPSQSRFLPNDIEDQIFYTPTNNGYENHLSQ
ncbi:MAG: replication-associated recombination protein A [Oligoflexales bacterium]